MKKIPTVNMWDRMELTTDLTINDVRYQRRKDREWRHWGELDEHYGYWKVISNETNWPDILDAYAELIDTRANIRNLAALQARCQGDGGEKHVERLLGIIEELYEALGRAETIGDFPEELRERYELKRFNETLTAKIPTHIYCENCESIQPLIMELMTNPAADGTPYVGGDLVCDRCKLVISTIWKPAP